MAKQVDINGFWLIEANPVTKEGVFPYLGSQIDYSGELNLEPNNIYNVLRPSSELETDEAVRSFNGVPFIDNHEMIGDGCTDYDDRPAGGILLNFRKGDRKGLMVADFKIFSESLKNSIDSGKKELSLGYRCKYEPQRGVHDGQTYDFIQTNITGNHIALVDKGRMGSEVRVYDSKTIVFDSIEELNEIQKGEDTMTDKEKSVAKRKAIGEALDGVCSEEEVKKAQDAIDPDEKEVEDEETEAEAEKVEDEETDDPKEKSEDDDEDKDEKKPATAEDTFAAIAPMIAARDALVTKVEPLVGAFDHAVMNATQVAVYACKKLGIACDDAVALPTLNGFLMNSEKQTKQFSMDSATVITEDTSFKNYLKGE